MSRATDILNKIRDGETYNLDIARSRAEEILIDICNNTNLSSNARSRYEELLLCIKNNVITTLTAQTRLEEILINIINGTLDDYLIGKNLYNGNFENGSISATTGENINSITKLRLQKLLNVIPNKTYTLALNQSENKFGIFNIHAYSQNGTWIGNRAYFSLESLGTTTTEVIFTVPNDVYSINFVLTVYNNSDATINIDDLSYTNIMLNVGSTASDFIKYSFEELEQAFINAFGGE